MKKIFTLVLIFATFSAFAQSLSLNYGTTVVNNGDTVEVFVSEFNDVLGMYCGDYFLDLTNVSEADVMVKVYKNELYMLEGADASLCFGGTCFPPQTSASNAYFLPAQTTLSHESENAFHLSYQTPITGISYVGFTFTNENNSDDQISMVFKLVCNPTSVTETAVATKMRAYPNPASGNVTVEYAYSGNSNDVKLVVKNLLGANVYTRKLDADGNKVKIDISEYNAGIYFYSIEADGRPLVTKKLLVK